MYGDFQAEDISAGITDPVKLAQIQKEIKVFF